MLVFLTSGVRAQASTWEVTSPDRGQTFAYGSERQEEWIAKGHHLAVALNFTNDPYVDQDSPRQEDAFLFNFSSVRLGPDGRTFYYHSPSGETVPVAIKGSGFLGTELRLLPSSSLSVRKSHGLLTLTLFISTSSSAITDDR